MFGLPVHFVKWVSNLPKVTPLPQTPIHVLGLANIRGSVVLLFDFPELFNLSHQKLNKVITLNTKDGVGLVVEEVEAVLNPGSKYFFKRSTPRELKEYAKYLCTVAKNGEKLNILDIEALLNSNLLNKLYFPPRFFKTAPRQYAFWFKDGRHAQSIGELIKCLKAMDDETFSFHVNDEKNDIAKWLRDVFDEQELASKVQDIKKRKELVAQLERAFY